MNFNVGVDNPAFVMWDGENQHIRDVSNFTSFGFTFDIVEPIVAATTFAFFYHNGTTADPCIPDDPIEVPEVFFCETFNGIPGSGPEPEQATITFPAGTPAGQYCVGTLPCRNGRFISIEPGGAGDHENVLIAITMHGRRR